MTLEVEKRMSKNCHTSNIKMTYNDLVLGMEDQIREDVHRYLSALREKNLII